MADVRVTALTPAPLPRPIDNSRSGAARAAQAAFFQAALGQATTPTTALKPVSAPASSTPVQATRAGERVRFDADSAPPMRPLRPGSLVDIKV